MNKLYLLLFSFSIFIFGLFFGNLDIFQQNAILLLDIVNNDKQNKTYEYFENDVDKLIKIRTLEEVVDKKNEIKKFIWKNKIPYTSSIEIINDYDDSRYSDIDNLDSIIKFSIKMDYNIISNGYLFLPKNSNDNIIIYHEGHAGDFIHGKQYIEFFISKNNPVFALSMPLSTFNNQPIIDLENFGKIKFFSHNQLSLLENENFSPMYYFVEPIGTSLNYLEKNYDFKTFNMVGISGGGWSTLIFSAIDDRIDHAFSIAGSLPIFMRTQSSDLGDYEQFNPSFYKIVNYLDLYILASYGKDRIFYQITNSNDPCCFAGNLSDIYNEDISLIIKNLNDGNFSNIIDTNSNHNISKKILEMIDKKINSN